MDRTGKLYAFVNAEYAKVVYEGEWYQNLKHGQGNYFYDDSTYYSGQWEFGMKSGVGKFIS